MLSMQNKNDFASTINKKGRVSNETNFQDVSSNDINKWKSSSSTRFKTPFETPSFKNQWNIKRNFKSPLILRELWFQALIGTQHLYIDLTQLSIGFQNLVNPLAPCLNGFQKLLSKFDVNGL
ncbi:hypothetical protein Tco_0883779 [Tanacetum coccineum]